MDRCEPVVSRLITGNVLSLEMGWTDYTVYLAGVSLVCQLFVTTIISVIIHSASFPSASASSSSAGSISTTSSHPWSAPPLPPNPLSEPHLPVTSATCPLQASSYSLLMIIMNSLALVCINAECKFLALNSHHIISKSKINEGRGGGERE